MVVLDALAAWPPGGRAVVVLRYWADLSVEQTAAALGCSPGNVKSQSARALDKLRAVLADAMTESGPPARPREERHETGDARMDETSLRGLLDSPLPESHHSGRSLTSPATTRTR